MITVAVPAFGQPGNPYSKFVGRWWQAIVNMRPAPAEVLVVHTAPEPLGLLDAAPSGVHVRGVVIDSHHIADFCNAAAAAASQPWVSCIGVDDCYRPDAIADLAAANAVGAEIMTWHQEEIGSHVWRCFWNPKTLRSANTLPGSSPFRRSLWQRVGGFPRIGWSDWGFWLRCAAAGAAVLESGRVGVDFDPGIGHATWSGRAMHPADKASRDDEIHAFVRELFA